MGNRVFGAVALKETSVENGYCCHLRYGSSIMQGWRRNQEDAMCVVLPYFEDFSFFAVYDGHGGAEVALYLKQKLHKVLKSYLRTEPPEVALQCAFNFIDLYLRSENGKNELNKIIDEMNAECSTGRKSNLARLLERLNTEWNEEPEEVASSNTSNASEENDSQPLVTGTSNNNNASELPSNFDSLNFLVNEELADSDSEDGSFVDNSESIQSEAAAEAKNDSNSQVSSEPGTNANDENEMETESESSENAQQKKPLNLFAVEPGVDSGSTVTVALVNPFKMFLANVGDSRCIISKKGEAINVSVDHNPDSEEELARIEKAAFKVTDGRIDGILNLSRAIGDFHFKKRAGLPQSQQSISPEPYVASVDIDDTVDFIVLATDGIWNSLSSQEVCDFITLRMSDSNVRISEICDELCHHCLESYDEEDGTGMDNMSIIIICPHTSQFANEITKQTGDIYSDEDNNNNNSSSDEDNNSSSGEVSTGSSDESTSKKRKAEIANNAAKRFKSNTGT